MNAKQARLSVVMGMVAALGTAAMLWAWWDSTENSMLWLAPDVFVMSGASIIVIHLGDFTGYYDESLGFTREPWPFEVSDLAELFPGIVIRQDLARLPMWFLLGVFLSVMLLLWLVLMKRLARPRITEG